MKNPWNDIIPLLPLQEFMSLTSVQGKLCASALCFYLLRPLPSCGLDTSPSSTQVALCLSICIEMMVAHMPSIPWVSPLLSLIFTSTLSVPLYDVAIVAPPLDLVMHPLMHYFIRDHA
ncbi:hypothetical protein BHM03_00032084 [Ensete ventricosum]|nr:hypothetical protein BHM03_00032084 [Ensete ventricosum]